MHLAFITHKLTKGKLKNGVPHTKHTVFYACEGNYTSEHKRCCSYPDLIQVLPKPPRIMSSDNYCLRVLYKNIVQ
jgi:hypothetical protein